MRDGVRLPIPASIFPLCIDEVRQNLRTAILLAKAQQGICKKGEFIRITGTHRALIRDGELRLDICETRFGERVDDVRIRNLPACSAEEAGAFGLEKKPPHPAPPPDDPFGRAFAHGFVRPGGRGWGVSSAI